MSEFLTARELAAALKVHLQTIYIYVKDGLPHLRVGGNLRFKLDEVESWFREPIVDEPERQKKHNV